MNYFGHVSSMEAGDKFKYFTVGQQQEDFDGPHEIIW